MRINNLTHNPYIRLTVIIIDLYTHTHISRETEYCASPYLGLVFFVSEIMFNSKD